LVLCPAAEDFNRPVGDHLVDIHVAACSRPGLKNIDRKLVCEFAVSHFPGRCQECGDLLGIQPVFSGLLQLPEVAIGDPASVFHQPHRSNQLGRQTPARDRKILDSPLRLRTVISVCGHGYFAHRIALDTHFRPGRRTGH